MKHYPHHIGDFDKATRHLTRIERLKGDTRHLERGQQRTVEQRGRMSAAQIGNSNKLGFVVSEETRLKLSASKIGNKNGAGNKGPVGNQNRKGIPHTEETKRLMSEKRKANFLKKQGAQA